MFKYNLLHVTFILCMSLCRVYSIMEEIPMPPALKGCLKKETEKNSMMEIPTEPINTLCEDSFLMQNTRTTVKFEPSQKDIDVVNSILKRFLVKQRRLKRQIGGVRWRLRRPKRKEIRRLTRSEWKRLTSAFQVIKRTGIYDSIAAIHRGESRLLRAHRGANFLSWHRILLKVLELSLQDVDPRVRLAYWDSSIDFYVKKPEDSILWTDQFFGSCRGEVIDGPFSSWRLGLDPNETLYRNCGSGGTLITKEAIRNVMRADYHTDITDETKILKYLEGLHNGPHVWCDGWLRLLYAAAEDPVFFFHHCFVDYLWYKFRQRQKLRGIDPEMDYPPSVNNPLHWANATMDPFYFMKNSDGYLDMWEAEYEETPSCNNRRPNNCKSKYLRCNAKKKRCETVMVSKPAARDLLGKQQTQVVKKVLPAGMTFESPFVDRRTAAVKPLEQEQVTSQAARRKRSVPASTVDHREKSYQNSFMLDGVADTSLWAFIPVNIIYKRPPGSIFDSKVVVGGTKVTDTDVYSPLYYENLKTSFPKTVLATNGKCETTGTGETKIYFQSQGINYNGFYKDFVVLDGKQALTSTLGYFAMKKPGNESSEAYLSAVDTCGRMCRATCKVKDTNPQKYIPCSGCVKLSNISPKMYGVDYGDAVSMTWNLDKNQGVPSLNQDNVFISFYCDYEPKWPWKL